MEPGLILTFAILIAVIIWVHFDQKQYEELSPLGEEWNFTKPTFNPKQHYQSTYEAARKIMAE